jgi:hypothetical protein
MICIETRSLSKTNLIRSQFLQEIYQHILHLDSGCDSQVYAHESLINVLLKSSNHPLTGKQRVRVFYQAIATYLEQETGQTVETFINLNTAGLGWVLIFCNRALVISQFLQNAEAFEFESVEYLVQEGETVIESALTVARSYFDFPAAKVSLKQAS